MKKETLHFLEYLSHLKRQSNLKSLNEYATTVRAGINPVDGLPLEDSTESEMIRSAVTYNPNQMEFNYA